MEKSHQIKKTVAKVNLHDQKNDYGYWSSQPPALRLDALEQIRQEYHLWRYGAEPILQRVYSIIKR